MSGKSLRTSFGKLKAAASGSVMVAALGVASAAQAGPWTVDTIGTGGYGWDVSAALDYQSNLHAVSYVDPSSMRVADLGATGWAVGNTYSAGGEQLAVDRKGQQVLALANSLNGITIRRRTGSGAWSAPETVVTGSHYAQSASVAFDGQNHAYVAYIDTTAQALMYARRGDDGTWQTTPVATGSTFQFNNAAAQIAVDTGGTPYLVWHDANTSTLQFAKPQAGGGFAVSSIAANYADKHALQFDNAGVLHVVYNDINAIRYATYNGSSWISQAAAVDVNVGGLPSLTFDAANNPHLAYAVRPFSGNDGLRHAVLQNGTWSVETAATWANTLDGSESAAITVDRRGTVRTVYTDDSQTLHSATSLGASAANPGRLATITPTFDATASSTNGGPFTVSTASMYVQQYIPPRPDFASENRGVMEFSLTGVPKNATVYSAQLRLTITGAASGASASNIDFYAYAGNGTPDVADASQNQLMVGSTGPFTTTLQTVTVDLDPAAVQALLAGGGNYLGILATSDLVGYQSSFAGIEWPDPSYAPALLINYSPEPASLSLIGLGGLTLLARRRRR